MTLTGVDTSHHCQKPGQARQAPSFRVASRNANHRIPTQGSHGVRSMPPVSSAQNKRFGIKSEN